MNIAEDKLWLVRLCWAELNGAVPQMNMSSLNSLAGSVQGLVVTDSKGVFDAVLKKETSGLGVKEGRAGLEMLCLRSSIRQHNTTLKWVNTYANVSDALTKAEAKPLLDRFLRGCRWRIVHDELMLSGKRRRAVGLYDGLSTGKSPKAPRKVKTPKEQGD